MKRIEIRGVIVPSVYDSAWFNEYIAKGLFTPESRFRKALSEAGDDVELYINSRGGSVFAGNEIVNAVKEFKASTGRKVEVTVGALAASMAANIVAMVGADKVRAHANAKFMFHGALGCTEGGEGLHKDVSGLLKSINADVIAVLAKLPGAKKNVVEGWFAEGREGWLTAQQALDMGLIGEIIGSDAEAVAALDSEAAAKMLESGFDAAAYDFHEPAATVPKAEYDALEARLAGLQSAKDKEISALVKERDDLKASLDSRVAELGQVTASLSAEKAAKEKAVADLGEEVKRRDAAEAKHKSLVGGVLGVTPDGKKAESATGFDKMVAAINENLEAKK